MNQPLDASVFIESANFKLAEFQDILSKIVECYKLMMSDGILVNNDENEIRDVLHRDYLNNNSIRNSLGLTDYLFDPEVPEANTQGRTDIKIQTPDTFLDTFAYYIIECKRLDNGNPSGRTGLNAKYIKNGIMRFVEGKYSTYCKLNGMIGFIVETMDINKNIQHINWLLDSKYFQTNTLEKLSSQLFIQDFKYQYCSVHKDLKNNKFSLYHLMLDFSKNLI
ncbi:hypothetical protein [Desulfobacter vibrioformis]|uniref:hypothetical protein n=1 Tax=Desulfobacter vibrioformis TaxID=34031 RepID=UPI0005520C16|nr:hypothetical protein [Desulfobacter vibrioformis]